MTSANAPLTAILFACWDSPDPMLQQLGLAPALMPLAGKPMVQRAIEQAVGLGCRRIELVLAGQMQAYELLLGDGERWGCALNYHYLPPASQPVQLLARLAPEADVLYWVVSADSVVTESVVPDGACVYCDDGQWSGWARLSGAQLGNVMHSARQREHFGQAVLALADTEQRAPQRALHSSSASSALNALQTLLADTAAMPTRPREPGIWIGNGSKIHPGAILQAPVWIGQNVLVREHAQIGPGSMLADGCVVDQGASVEQAIVLPGTYIGQGLHVNKALVKGNLIANLEHGVTIHIPDRAMLAQTQAPELATRATPWTQRLIAALLWLLFWPLAGWRHMLRQSASELARTGQDPHRLRYFNVRMVPSHAAIQAGVSGAWGAHFRTTFYPGLRDVAAGKLNLVGITPRTSEEIHALPLYWQRIYRRGRSGLFNETLLLGRAGASQEMCFIGDAIATEALSLGRLLLLLKRYFAAVWHE